MKLWRLTPGDAFAAASAHRRLDFVGDRFGVDDLEDLVQLQLGSDRRGQLELCLNRAAISSTH